DEQVQARFHLLGELMGRFLAVLVAAFFVPWPTIPVPVAAASRAAVAARSAPPAAMVGVFHAYSRIEGARCLGGSGCRPAPRRTVLAVNAPPMLGGRQKLHPAFPEKPVNFVLNPGRITQVEAA